METWMSYSTDTKWSELLILTGKSMEWGERVECSIRILHYWKTWEQEVLLTFNSAHLKTFISSQIQSKGFLEMEDGEEKLQ